MGEITEAGLAIARKVILCAGLLTGALLFLYPHWKTHFEFVGRNFEYDVGRSFITSPPAVTPFQFAEWVGFNAQDDYAASLFRGRNLTHRVHRVRQLTEVAIALLFTFGLMRALKKPAGD